MGYGIMEEIIGDWKKCDKAFIWRACHSNGSKAIDTKFTRSRVAKVDLKSIIVDFFSLIDEKKIPLHQWGYLLLGTVVVHRQKLIYVKLDVEELLKKMKCDRQPAAGKKTPRKKIAAPFAMEDELDDVIANPRLDAVNFERHRARLEEITLREPEFLDLDNILSNENPLSDAILQRPLDLDDPEILRHMEELFNGENTLQHDETGRNRQEMSHMAGIVSDHLSSVGHSSDKCSTAEQEMSKAAASSTMSHSLVNDADATGNIGNIPTLDQHFENSVLIQPEKPQEWEIPLPPAKRRKAFALTIDQVAARRMNYSKSPNSKWTRRHTLVAESEHEKMSTAELFTTPLIKFNKKLMIERENAKVDGDHSVAGKKRDEHVPRGEDVDKTLNLHETTDSAKPAPEINEMSHGNIPMNVTVNLEPQFTPLVTNGAEMMTHAAEAMTHEEAAAAIERNLAAGPSSLFTVVEEMEELEQTKSNVAALFYQLLVKARNCEIQCSQTRPFEDIRLRKHEDRLAQEF